MPCRPRAVVASVVATAALLATILGSGCSSGSPFGGDDGASTCTLIQRLGATADRVERADLADPDEFERVLDDAVVQYVEIVDDLLESGPDELREPLRALKAAAEQYRFSDALEARATLDEFAARECGLRAPVTTTCRFDPSALNFSTVARSVSGSGSMLCDDPTVT